MNTFRNEQYTITTSLADHNIVVNVVNNISYVGYEGIFNPRTVGISVGLADTFTLINKCFADYVNPAGSSKVEIELIQNTGAEHLMVKFYYMVDGLLEMHFIVRLVEKRVAAGDKGLIVEMNRQKQMITDLTGTVEQMRLEMERQKKYIVELMNRMEGMNRTLSNKLEKPDLAPIEDRVAKFETTTNDLLSKADQRFAKLENEVSDVITGIDSFGHAEIELLKIDLWNSGGFSNNILPYSLHVPLNVKTLTLECFDVRTANGANNESLQKLKFLYQLETLHIKCMHDIEARKYLSNDSVSSLTITECHVYGRDMSFITQFPNLKELTMRGCIIGSNVVSTLRTLPHKIKRLEFDGNVEGGEYPIMDKVEMKRYCGQNRIKLILR